MSALIWPATASAQQVMWPSLSEAPVVGTEASNDVALIIAVEDYVFLPEIEGAVENARDWETFFRDGLRVSETLMLTNYDATREDILSFAHRAAGAANQNGRLWVIFIGHGTPAADGSEGALVGSDARQTVDSLAHRSVAQSELLEILVQGAQSETLVILDTCFSGRATDGSALAEGAMPVVAVSAAPQIARNTVLMTGAESHQFAGALPGAPRPAFSYLLLGALRGWAADSDGNVSAEEAIEFTRRHLRRIPGREQTPQLVGVANLVLTEGAREVDPLPRHLPGVTSRGERQECRDGQFVTEDTDGNCCWRDQVWDGSQCVGVPPYCPLGLRPDRDTQSCLEVPCPYGQERQPDGQSCCWPGQAFSQTRQVCVGVPNCPAGTSGTQCRPDDHAEWHRAGCDAGHGSSCHSLAQSLVRQDSESSEADQLFREGCRLGHAASCVARGDKMLDRNQEYFATWPYPTACRLTHDPATCATAGALNWRFSSSQWNQESLTARARDSRVFLEIGCEGASTDPDECSALAQIDEFLTWSEGGDFSIEEARTRACELGAINPCPLWMWTESRGGFSIMWNNNEITRTCELDVAIGCYYLADRYYNGRNGLEVDHERALELYQQACDMDHGSSCNSAGLMTSRGHGSEPDPTASRQLYERGCELGHATSCGNLGYRYRDGAGGVAQDFARARQLFEEGCEGGAGFACHSWAQMTFRGEGDQEADTTAARDIWERGCDLNHARSCGELGAYYRNDNLDTPRDIDRARELYETACNGGTQFACDRLNEL